jgi:hypothetical protein
LGQKKKELLVEKWRSRKKGPIQKVIRVNAKPKEKKEEKKGEMKPIGEVRKKKDKKEVTCYHYWEKEHYTYECLKKMTT